MDRVVTVLCEDVPLGHLRVHRRGGPVFDMPLDGTHFIRDPEGVEKVEVSLATVEQEQRKELVGV